MCISAVIPSFQISRQAQLKLELILQGTETESNRGVKIVDFLDRLLNITRLYCSLNLHSIRDGR